MKTQPTRTLLACLLALATSASAAENSYIGTAGTGNWNDTTVWSAGTVPIGTDSVYVTNAVTADRTVTNGLSSTLIADLVISNSATTAKNTVVVFAPASGTTFFSVTNDTVIGSNGVLFLARTTAATTINVTNRNLYLLDNAVLRASDSSAYTVNYIVTGAFSNSAASTISRNERVTFNLTFVADAPIVNNGTISYFNTGNAAASSFRLTTTNAVINNGTIVYGFGGNPSAAASALPWQSTFVNNGLLSLINTNTRTTGVDGTVKMTITGKAGHAFTNTSSGTVRFFSNPTSRTNNPTAPLELTFGDFVNLGTISSDARKDITNLLTLAASGAVFSNAVGGQVIVINSNFTIRADNVVNLGTNIVQNKGLLTYQTRTGGDNALHNAGVLRLETGTIRALAGITNTASGSIIGNGTLSGNVTSAGSISPGLSLGTLTFTGNLTLPGIYAANLDGTGSGSADMIIVASQLDLTGGTLFITTNAPLDDVAYIIASYDSLVGTFATVSGLPSPYYVDYNYLGGQQIAVVIPEPSTVFLAGSGLILGLLVWRRRRRR